MLIDDKSVPSARRRLATPFGGPDRPFGETCLSRLRTSTQVAPETRSLFHGP